MSRHSAAHVVLCAFILSVVAPLQATGAQSSRSAASASLVTPSPYLVTRNGTTYQAQSQANGTTFTGTLKFAVESAVNDLGQSGGGTVTFSAGTFDFGSAYFRFENISDIVFEGQGIDATVIQNSSSAKADTEPFNFSGTTRVTIRDLTVSAGGPARTTSDALDFDRGNDSTVERVKITAARGRAIVFDGKDAGASSSNNVIRDCVITGVQSDGIELLASSNNLVERCTVTNVAGHGLQIAKSSTSAAQPNKKSNDNVFRNNVVDNAGQDGINVNAGDRNRIEGNTVTNSSNVTANRDGIRVGTSDGISCDDTVVQGNTATDNQPTKTQRYGLAISSSLCNRTVVGPNDFTGNRVGSILDQGTTTQYTGSDTEPPTAPSDVRATAPTHAQVDVSWSASTDNVGVTGYRIYRDGSLTPLATVGGGTLGHADTTVAPNTTYSYTVEATDAAGNPSAKSSPPTEVTTPLAPADPQSPTVPTNVQATAISYALVRVTWTASTDNLGVTGYRIYRNGSLTPLAAVGGGTLGYDDTSVAPNTTYQYTIDAVDAAANASEQSPPAQATTPPAPSSLTFMPEADSYVNESSATSNFGTSTQLRADGAPVVRGYLRFTVQGVVGTVMRAKLRIYANSSSSVGHDVRGVTDITWGETTINFTNSPAVGSVAGSSGLFSGGNWIEVDVTSLITGNGTYSLAVTTPSGTAISYGSRESATKPELALQVG